jgi:hypothetical protein
VSLPKNKKNKVDFWKTLAGRLKNDSKVAPFKGQNHEKNGGKIDSGADRGVVRGVPTPDFATVLFTDLVANDLFNLLGRFEVMRVWHSMSDNCRFQGNSWTSMFYCITDFIRNHN